MYGIIKFIFSNIIIFALLGFAFYIYIIYKDLNNKKAKMQDKFDRFLNKYLGDKINLAKETAKKIINEYGREDAIRTEVIRLQVVIEKGASGSIIDKVNTSNALNKYRVSKDIDVNRYTYFKDLENIKTFYDIDLDSIKDDIAISRRDYNRLAIEYNQKASGFPMQYFVNLLNVESQFPLFDKIVVEKYTDKYEELEEAEPEINNITSLNIGQKNDDMELPALKEQPASNPTPDIEIEHSNETFKPSINIK